MPSEVAAQTAAEVVGKKPATRGRPRQTDSLCPDCEKEARNAIIHGKKEWRDFRGLPHPRSARGRNGFGFEISLLD